MRLNWVVNISSRMSGGICPAPKRIGVNSPPPRYSYASGLYLIYGH